MIKCISKPMLITNEICYSHNSDFRFVDTICTIDRLFNKKSKKQ